MGILGFSLVELLTPLLVIGDSIRGWPHLAGEILGHGGASLACDSVTDLDAMSMSIIKLEFAIGGDPVSSTNLATSWKATTTLLLVGRLPP